MNLVVHATILVTTLIFAASSAVAHSAPPLPMGCAANSAAARAACIYSSYVSVDPAQTGVVEGRIFDVSRDSYEILYKIRYPTSLTGRRPIIIWNHGGDTRTTGRDGSPGWGEALAQAGYIVVHPSRSPAAPRQITANRTVCNDNGVPQLECADWLGQSYYGATNTDVLISSLPTIEIGHSVLAGKMDYDRIAVAGWSAGSAVALSNAGARRQFKRPSLATPRGGPIYDWKSSRPIAFMAVAPFGPDYAGFNYHPRYSIGGFFGAGLASIDERPFLFVTGKADQNAVAAEARTAAFFHSNPSGKILAWSTSSDAVHGTMDLSQCDANARQLAQCRWIKALGLAFMDAHLLGRQSAMDWLNSGALGILTNNEIELHRRPPP